MKIANISKSFKSGSNNKVILQNVNLNISNGTWCTIMGPSGSGKSTLLNCISGLLKPNEGKIHINDININELYENSLSEFRRNNIGFVFQDFKLLPYYSVLDNVILPLVQDRSKTELVTRARKLLVEVGIEEDLYNRLPKDLSGGEKQRVAIARALIAEPNLLLCDEPTGNLDSDTRNQIINLLLSLKQNGQTIILVTHDEEVAKYSDNIYQLINGKLLHKELIK
ncbi:ABC transporter ATP-binding protein [Allobacillus sp. GCM10007491]|nr:MULTISPECIES: ABC transporter ATP-binding protein [Allobacillus]MBR7554703.1 ABC transporter ATP-binding protein [Allobacillus saliphilus]